MIDWLFTNALAALALAAIAGVLIWTFRPAPAVRHALWLVVLLKLVSPTGLVVEVPLPVENPSPVVAEATPDPVATLIDDVVEVEVFTVYVNPQPGQSPEEALAAQWRQNSATTAARSSSDAAATATSAPTPPPPAESEFRFFDAASNYRPYLLGLWVVGAVAIGWRQLRETARFARFTRRSHPASDTLVAEVAVVANRLGVRVPAVRVMTGLASPVIWCLWRPVLLWPAGLECRLKGDGRRAVLAHELAHLRRRDHWVRRLEMVAAVLHWWNPLFWVARKKMRADAELACDAWAAGQADRRAYAEALLEVCSFNPRRRPAPAVGVIGEGRRAMQERLTMIMRDRVPCRLAFGAKLVVALMAIAAVPAWTLGPGAEPVAAQSAQSDAQVQELEAQIKALAVKLEALKKEKQAAAEAVDTKAKRAKAVEALTEADVKKIKAAQEKVRAAGEKAVKDVIIQGQSGVKVVTAGEEGYKVIGPDGKEVKNVKIIIGDGKGVTTIKPSAQGTTTTKPLVVDAQSGKWTTTATRKPLSVALSPDGKNYSFSTTFQGSGGQAVTLSRATYKMNRDQAAALSTLLGSIKATVMETKVDGDSITVTTTPEAQAAIGQIVRLVQGQGGQSTFEWKVAPTEPTPPTPPTKPTPPVKPVRPTSTLNLNELELKLDSLQKFPVELKFDTEKLKDVTIQLEKPKDLEKLKELKIDVEKLKNVEKLKELKIDVEKFKDLEKLKELEKLKDLKDIEKLKDAIKLLVPAEKEKPRREKKPDEPAK